MFGSDLLAIADRVAQAPSALFTGARPFPHITFDDLFPHPQLRAIHDQFFTLADSYWQKSSDQGIEVKWRSNWRSEYDIPEPARELVRFLNSGAFLRALSQLTNIPNLIADPYYTGGGFNFIKRGGHLDVHVDGNWHDMMQVNRRLNLILYLNAGWRDEWGGGLNLYDAEARNIEATIVPRGNRLLIFETHDFSYHGHPEPLCCPENEGRSSIILYYYTSKARPPSQVSVAEPHSALWRSKNWRDKRGNVTRTEARS